MPRKVVFIHTVHGLKELYNGLLAHYAPGMATCHIADETMIQEVIRAKGPTPYVFRRMCAHIAAAAEAGADLIQVTCSSVSPCVDAAARLVSVPVLKADEAMIAAAVKRYRRIGVIATNPGTLGPSTAQVRLVAQQLDKTVRVIPELCTGAYDAFFRGDLQTHDALVQEHLAALLSRCDVVLLAQASMARLAGAVRGSKRQVPIRSSPKPAVKRLAALLKKM